MAGDNFLGAWSLEDSSNDNCVADDFWSMGTILHKQIYYVNQQKGEILRCDSFALRISFHASSLDKLPKKTSEHLE